MQACDLLISAGWVLPVAPANVALENHAVAVHDGRIIAVGPTVDLEAAWDARTSLNLPQHILMPGLVNAHGHAAMSLLRGAGEDQPLAQWLNDTIWPLEARVMNPEYVRLGTELTIAEMLLTGTTTFSDMYFYPEVVAEVTLQQGLRAQLAFPLIQFANPWSESVEDALHKGLEMFHQFRHEDRIHIALGPHAPYTLTDEDMERIGMYAAELDIMVQTHLHETAAEVAEALSDNGKSWIRHLSDIGWLSPQLQAVHMTQISAEEMALVAESGTHVVHCPASNLKLASGYCPVTELQAADVCVALGTDGAASNNRLDLFDEARLAALLAKHTQGDAAVGKADHMIRMATLDGARALGIDHLTGSLEVGKAADLITVDTTALGILPVYNPFAALVHGNAGTAVDNVFVNGEALVEDGGLTRMHLGELADRVQAWQSQSA